MKQEAKRTETVFLQVRTKREDKEKAAEILDELGTNLSSVVNMLLKQIIIKGGIPFDVSMNPDVMIKEPGEKAWLLEHFGNAGREEQQKIIKELSDMLQSQ